MFESIAFFNQNRTNVQRPLDIGNLVECMLFYGETTVYSNRNILKHLFIYFGIDGTIELIEEGLLKLVYSESSAAIHTNTDSNGFQVHDAINVSSPQHTFQIEITKVCQEVTGKSGKGRRLANRIMKLIPTKEPGNVILEGARASFLDQEFIIKSFETIIQGLIPEPVSLADLMVESEQTSAGIVIRSNLNYDKLNQVYHKYTSPKHSSLSPALLLSHILTTESEIWYAALNSSEIATSKVSSGLMKKKVDHVIDRSLKSSEQLNRFNELVIDEGKTIREAVNSNQIQVDKMIELLKKSKKFKKWIVGVDVNGDLVKSYIEEVTKESFAEKLPTKSVRWGIFTGIGVAVDLLTAGGAGTLIGAGVGTLDSFVVDKLIKGWKPNQFVDNEIKPLLK